MKESFQNFLLHFGLKLIKIVEQKDQSLTLVFEQSENNEVSSIEDELKPYFTFAKGIQVKLLNQKVSSKISKSEDKLEKQKDKIQDFSLQKYQEEKLNKRKAEISNRKVQLKNESPSPKLKPGEMICGKRITTEPIAIEEIDFTDTVHESNVCIEGDIFDTDVKEISDKSELFTISLTDYTGSIYLKRFSSKSKKNENSLLKEYIKSGKRIKVLGDLEYDDFLSATCSLL